VAVVIALAWGFAAGSPPAAAAPPFTVVMEGLDNPRGLTFGDDGALYVAEAGRGGSAPCTVLRGTTFCAGRTGAVTRLYKGVQQRIVTDLPSYAPPSTGAGATGPHDVSVRGRALYVLIGLGGDPMRTPTDIRAALDPDLGRLIRARRHAPWRRVADIARYEERTNPGGGPLDSNPYGLLAGAGGHLIADAGGNALLRVSAWGTISTLAAFPSRPHRATDAVPTAVTQGPDGAYYVGELTGGPFAVGAARVYRIIPGSDPQIFLEGFTAIIDVTFGPDDNLYVLQHATGAGLTGPGALIRVSPNGQRTTVASEGLTLPTAVVIAPADRHRGHHQDANDEDEDEGEGEDARQGRLTFYISNCGTCAGVGEVIRVRP
jgi:hypothetical protein